MQTKLTLRMEDSLIRRAKILARRSGKSVSALVADYIAALDARTPGDSKPRPRSHPKVTALRGSLAQAKVAERDYRAHLERKHR